MQTSQICKTKDHLPGEYTCPSQAPCVWDSSFTETGGLVVCNEASVDNIYESSSTFVVHKSMEARWAMEGRLWTSHLIKCWDQFQDIAVSNETSDWEWLGDHCLHYAPRSDRLMCVDCPAGWRLRDRRIDDDSGVACAPSQQDGQTLQQLRDAPYERLAAMQLMPTPRYCPEGFFERTNWGLGRACQPCPKNCLRCMFPESCTMCRSGFMPTFNNSHCDPLLPPGKTADYSLEEILAPRPFCDADEFLLYTRCMPCHEYLPHCEACQATTRDSICTRCERGYLLSKDPHRQRCIQMCKRGSYFDENTERCVDCPKWCRVCTANGCVACARGLYKLLNRNEYLATCHYECPPGTYPTNQYPFYCRRCHYTCRTCWGPTSYHCYECYFHQFADDKSLSIRCGGIPGDPAFPDVRRFTPQYIEFQREMLQRLYSSTTTYFAEENMYSNHFGSFRDWRKYFAGESLTIRYPYFCRDEKCLNHCDPATATLFHPCITCLPGYVKDMLGYCIHDCPDGTFWEQKLNRCILCYEPVGCKICRWREELPTHYRLLGFSDYASIIQQPLYWRSNLTDEEDDRQECVESRVPELHVGCHLDFEFQDALGYCKQCHPECIGCTGYGPSNCKECLHGIRDQEGRCTSECRPGYDLVEPLPGAKICTLQMRPSDDTIHVFRMRHSETGAFVFLYFFAMLTVYVCSQFSALYVALFLGRLDKAELICWGYEDIVAQAAVAHLEELLVLKRSGSGTVGSGSRSRRAKRRGSATTVEATFACNTRYDTSSSNGSTRRRKKRVFIRPNLGAKMFKSWKRKQKEERRAQGLPVSVTQDSWLTSIHSEPTQETGEKPTQIRSQRSAGEDATSGDRLNSDPLSSAAVSKNSAREEPAPHPDRSSPGQSWRLEN